MITSTNILNYIKKTLAAIEHLYKSSVYLEQKIESIEKELKEHQKLLQEMVKYSRDLKSFEERIFKANEREKNS
jgi:predicted  nucleic acid-binding Zn-ribbon protein